MKRLPCLRCQPLACPVVLPSPPRLLADRAAVLCLRHRDGTLPVINLPYVAVLALWGIDISTGWYGKSVLPEPIELRVVLELVGEPGSGADEEGAGAGGGGAGAAADVASSGDHGHGLVFKAKINFRRSQGAQKDCLSTTVPGCPGLQRALVGLERRGVRRLGDGTVALVMARAPAAAAGDAVKEETVEGGRQVCSVVLG
jgi:hypothetical protein